MINFLKTQKAIIGLVVILFTFHFLSKDITDPYERPIAGDAQAYYAYLPAIFIYQDLDYQFIDKAAAPHYAPGHLKDFVVDVDGQKVNKTFPGVTVLYAPFFFAGHISAKILGKPADGYSSIYQLWFDIGIWFYFLFSLVFMRKVLEKLQFSTKTALLTTILITLGTNIFFYTVYDQSVTHIHNFFMINGLILCLLNFKESLKTKWLVIAIGLLVLIGITRPTNILVIGLILFFFSTLDFYKSIFKRIFSKEIWKFMLVSLPILSLPFILWKLQTGNWIVYSYGEEGFDFAHPHFSEFLFSYTKGWLTYTPIALLILVPGLILLFNKSKLQFGIATVFYLISIFVFSSWWCWYYGAGMSQRVMIDHYILLAFLLALIIQYLQEKPLLKGIAATLGILLLSFNIAQAYQIKNGIIQFGSATQEQYWSNFLVFQKKAEVYPKEHWELVETVEFSNEKPVKGENFTKNVAGFETYVDVNYGYSAVFEKDIKDITKESKLVVSFEVKTEESLFDTRAVLSLYRNETEYGLFGIPFYFSEYVVKGEWIKMEFLFEADQNYLPKAEFYFWNAHTSEKVEFRSLKVTHYKSDEYM